MALARRNSLTAADSQENDVVSTRASLVRLRPTGLRGRGARLSMTTGLLIGVPVAACVRLAENAGSAELPVYLLGIAVSILLLVLWVRFPMTGLYLDGDHLLVRSWWSTRRFPRSTMQRCRAEPYGGLFFIFGWPVSGGMLQSGHVILEAGGISHTLGGTVTSLGVAVKQAETINRWLGLSVGAGVGERRSRARRARTQDGIGNPRK